MSAPAAIHADISERDYRAMTGLSGSSIHRLLTNPRTFSDPVDVTEAMRLGTAVHARVLGTDMEVRESDKWATLSGAAAKAWAIECDLDGAMPLLGAWAERIDAMEAAIQRNPEAVRLLSGEGVNEQALSSQWRGVPVKGRPDRINTYAEGLVAVDLKTGRDPEADKSIYGWGYDRQAFFYERLACEVLGLEPAMPPQIIYVGSTAPHTCVVWSLQEWEREAAYADIDAAIDLYAACMARDEWPDWAELAPRHPSIPVWTARERDTTHAAVTAWLGTNELENS